MMIDFSKIVELVPDGGRLILTFTAKADKKQNGDEATKEVSVVFAQQFKGKENDNDFSPIIITGGVVELSESFESTIADIARDQKRLAELKTTTTTGRVDQKKKQLSDAIQKHTKAADKSDPKKEGEQKEEKKVEAKEEKPKPIMADLFSMSPARPAVSETTIVTSAPESEASEAEPAEGVDHG